MLVTLDDNLYENQENPNYVKMLSARKADKNGHNTYVFCDALFWVTLKIGPRRRDESQGYSIDKLVDSFIFGHGEPSMRGLIATVGRGYVCSRISRRFEKSDMSGVVIVCNHLLRYHSFASDSSFNVTSHDEGTDVYYDINEGDASVCEKKCDSDSRNGCGDDSALPVILH